MDGVRQLMTTVYSNIIVGKEKAGSTDMPVQKVERVELFGGLKYISHAYFIFVLIMEYVLTHILTP